MYNTKIFTETQLVKLIEDHKLKVAPHNEYYQLAHDHIIRLIKDTTPDLLIDSIYIGGYRVKDLIVVAERLHKEDREPLVVEAANEAFLAGYKMAQADFNKSLEESINNFIGRV